MPNRRSFLIGTGTVFVGASVLLGTGAFSSVSAERTVAVNTAGDANALLGIEPGAEGDEYVTENGTVDINVTGTSAGGQGVNQNAITAVDQLLEVTNNGTTDVAVGFDDAYAIQEGDYSEAPGGWAYAVNNDEDAAVVVWASPLPADLNDPLSEIRPELVSTGFDGSTLVSGNSIHSEVEDNSERTISPGESLNMGLIVDTRDSTVEDNPLPAALDDTITIYAERNSGGGSGGGGGGGGPGGTPSSLVTKIENDEDITLQQDTDLSSLDYSDTATEYDGTLNGNGQEIQNIDIDGRGTGANTGFIDKLSAAGEIKNLIIKDPIIKGDNQTGFIGYAEGDIENVDLENVTVEGSQGNRRVGALVGGFNGKITDSSAEGTVDGYRAVGGLVGQTYEQAEIIDSYAKCDVTGDYWDVGGLVGNSFGDITNSYATGDVTQDGVANGNSYYVGGLVGSHYGHITESYATGDVDGENRVGGLVGHNKIGWYDPSDNEPVSIIDSYATGDVSATGNRVGGLAGWNGGRIETSYAVGPVTASGGSYEGGLVGDNVTDNGNNGTVIDSYWDKDETGQTSSEGGGTGLTTSEMQGSTADQDMSELDFSGTWTVVTNPADYPVLQALNEQDQLDARD